MLQHNNVTRKKILFYLIVRFHLSIVYDLPLVEVLRDIGVVSFEDLVWILSSPWRPRPILRGLIDSNLLVEYKVLRHMDIRIVLLVV